MAEYNKNTDWGSVIDGLRLCIDKTSCMYMKITWLCEILLLMLCSTYASDNTAIILRGNNYVITNASCVSALSIMLTNVSTRAIGMIFRYRDLVCHRGVIEAHALLKQIPVEELAIMFKEIDVAITVEDLQAYVDLPALRAI